MRSRAKLLVAALGVAVALYAMNAYSLSVSAFFDGSFGDSSVAEREKGEESIRVHEIRPLFAHAAGDERSGWWHWPLVAFTRRVTPTRVRLPRARDDAKQRPLRALFHVNDLASNTAYEVRLSYAAFVLASFDVHLAECCSREDNDATLEDGSLLLSAASLSSSYADAMRAMAAEAASKIRDNTLSLSKALQNIPPVDDVNDLEHENVHQSTGRKLFNVEKFVLRTNECGEIIGCAHCAMIEVEASFDAVVFAPNSSADQVDLVFDVVIVPLLASIVPVDVLTLVVFALVALFIALYCAVRPLVHFIRSLDANDAPSKKKIQ